MLGLCFGNLYCKNTLNPAFYTKESIFLRDLDDYLDCNLIYADMLDVDSCPQGLSCQIYIEEERAGDLEYFFYHYTNWKVPYIEEDSFFETSTGLFMGYRICKVCGIELYTVALACEDSKTGNRIFVVYTIPFEDNEDEILELRELGIPVITDFIK